MIKEHQQLKDQSARSVEGSGNLEQTVDEIRRAGDEAGEVDEKEVRRILKKRAMELAALESGPVAVKDTVQLVVFVLDRERYGIELAHVSEVQALKEIVALPGTPNYVLGIINVRGRIFSIISLKRFFELAEKAITDQNRVILLETDGMEFGILADAIIGVQEVELDSLQPSMPTLTGIRAQYLKGVTPDRIAVLDGAGILADSKIIVDDYVSE